MQQVTERLPFTGHIEWDGTGSSYNTHLLNSELHVAGVSAVHKNYVRINLEPGTLTTERYHTYQFPTEPLTI